MKKLFYLGFAAVLAMSFGCAVTDYELITSNNSGIVNTNGKAFIRPSAQIATIWPDGTDNFVNYVDQKANGDQTLTSYNFYVAGDYYSGTIDPFLDFLYCQPAWNGCAITTADNPVVGDVDPFDYRFNDNCSGARSLSLLTSTTRYYGECGRTTARPSISQRLEMAMNGKETAMFGQQGLLYNVGPQNLSISLTNERGETYLLPINGHTTVWAQLGHSNFKAAINVTNPVLATTVRAYADFLANHATYGKTDVTITYAGVSVSGTIAGRRNGPISNEQRASEIANRF